MTLLPGQVSFCVLCFEGPDRYSQAGGLGVRVTHLAQTLAQRGFETHLLFVGDPSAPGRERRFDEKLTLHRWCQWISAYHPAGVYAAEESKLRDFTDSAPPFIIENIIRPALKKGRLPVILAEEWHTVEATLRLHNQLEDAGLRRRCVLFWNANNTMSFHRVDWARLQTAAQLTTVSRYMKHLMWNAGLNPLVIPNGIPAELLLPVASDQVQAVQKTLITDDKTVMLFKVGRFDPAKRWLMAVEAAARLKAEGYRVVFPLRGGIESHGSEVLDRARQLGLSIADLNGSLNSWEALLNGIRSSPRADIYNVCFPMSQETLRPFFVAADAVLANSGHEPFGLVGLEAMAAGGLVFTGATGEEYSLGGRSAVTLDTDLPDEIVTHVLELRTDAERAEEMRRAAHSTAANYTWNHVSDILLDKVKFVARSREALAQGHGKQRVKAERVRDVVIYTLVHQPRRLRLPARPLTSGATSQDLARGLFDDELNEKYFRKVAQTCYYPATAKMRTLLNQGFKFSIGFSLSFVEQALRWDKELLKRLRRLVRHKNVELVAVEPYHSFILLWDISKFIKRMRYGAEQLNKVFGVRPVIADTTEFMMSDTIYNALDLAGFKAGFLDGRSWVMHWRRPTYLYHQEGGQMKLLARHYQLSDDVGYRFSNQEWEGWPLMANRYAEWLAGNHGNLVVLGWDFETFGEHHRNETGIFDFLEALPREAQKAGLSFITPSEALERYSQESRELPLPAFASTWAGEGGLEFFLGNGAQQAVLQLMIQAYQKACLTGNQSLIELALWLAQSDNLHLIQWYGRSGSDAEVSAYFTPEEWWSLGPDGIIWEMQEVYKNFIAALGPHVGTSFALKRLFETPHGAPTPATTRLTMRFPINQSRSSA